MIEKGSNVQGINFQGDDIKGVVEHIVGFTDEIAIVRINHDRLGFTECYIENLKEV